MNSEEIVSKLRAKTNKKNLEGMARFGIKTEKAFGISIPLLRTMAKEILSPYPQCAN